MKKMLLIAVCMITLSAVCTPVVPAKENIPPVINKELTPENWDKEFFAPLTPAQREEILFFLVITPTLYRALADSIDKGPEVYLEIYMQLIQFYNQIVMGLTPQADMYTQKMPLLRALQILPDSTLVHKVAIKILGKEIESEEDLKKSINKALRNKATKEEIQGILKKQIESSEKYANYLQKVYEQEIAACMVQLQEKFGMLLRSKNLM